MSDHPKHLWQPAKLLATKQIAANVKMLRLEPAHWFEHKPGQHYDIRLTAPSGYQAERSYSVASAPEEKNILEFGIELLEKGEVSPYLWNLAIGEHIEVRGPVGGHFVWDISVPGPLGLIAGGSGMVPLMSMLRHYVHHAAKDPKREIVFLISVRSLEHLLYREELSQIEQAHPNVKIVLTLTGSTHSTGSGQASSPQADKKPDNWKGYARRIDAAMMHEVFSSLLGKMPMLYVCGPTPFVEVAGNLLVDMKFNSHEVRTERFGG